MHFPKAFQQAEPVPSSGSTVVLYKDESGLANMNLQIGETGDETLTKVFQDIQKGLPTMAPGATVHGNGHTKINKQPARWIELSHSAGGNDVRVIVYILVNKQRYIMIFCTADERIFETHRAAFRDSAESLKTL